MKSRPPAPHSDEIYAAKDVARGRMGEVGYSKSQPESKFDFRAARDHRSAVFFLLEYLSLSPFPPLPRLFAPPSSLPGSTARPEVAQTRQGSYLLEERVLRVTAGCSLFLDYCYAGMAERKTETEGGRRRKNGRVCVGEGKKRAKETRWMEVERVRELSSENIENRAYHSAK